jgi:GNAT superfamily N-acetyltransferase
MHEAEANPVLVRPLAEEDLEEADRIFRVAFGTFLGAVDPERFFGDADFVRTRWRANPGAALAAEIDGRLVGSNFAGNWGSVGFFGPLTVEPTIWDRAVGRRLVEATMELFDEWGTAHVGLFTFPQSGKHVGLYQRFGFWPRFLTGIFSAPVKAKSGPTATRLSELNADDRLSAIESIRVLTDAIYPGLDLGVEIDAVDKQGLGDSVVIDDASDPNGIAVCHIGAGTEAGGGNCYIKFGGVRPGPRADHDFRHLILACQSLASDRGARVLVAGMNAGRERAWRALEELGFRRDIQGVTMHRPNEAGYSTNDAFIIDDWR